MQMWTFMSTKLNLVWIFWQFSKIIGTHIIIFQDYWNTPYYFPWLLEHTISYVRNVSIFLLLFSNLYLVFWILLMPPNRQADMPRILKKKRSKNILIIMIDFFTFSCMWWFAFIQCRFFSCITFLAMFNPASNFEKSVKNVNLRICLFLHTDAGLRCRCAGTV